MRTLDDPADVLRNKLLSWLNFRTSYVSFSRLGFQILQEALDAGIVPRAQHLETGSETTPWICPNPTFPTPNPDYEWKFCFWMLQEDGGSNRTEWGLLNDLTAITMYIADAPIEAR